MNSQNKTNNTSQDKPYTRLRAIVFETNRRRTTAGPVDRVTERLTIASHLRSCCLKLIIIDGLCLCFFCVENYARYAHQNQHVGLLGETRSAVRRRQAHFNCCHLGKVPCSTYLFVSAPVAEVAERHCYRALQERSSPQLPSDDGRRKFQPLVRR